VLVDATAIKNCCNVAVGDLYFSINKNSSPSLTCVDKELQYKDIVTLSLMEEDGWLFRGKKMALKIQQIHL